MSTQTTRRALVASAVALPALAVPALASIDNPDAELFRLGMLLVPLERERADRNAFDRAQSAAFDREFHRRTGITMDDARERGDINLGAPLFEVSRQISSEVYGTAEDEKDENGDTPWDRINSRLFPVLDDILAERATTQEGLKIQARAAAIAAAELWYSEPTHERLFIEAACAFLGMDARAIATCGNEA